MKTKDTSAEVLDKFKVHAQQGLNQHVTLVIGLGVFCPLMPLVEASPAPSLDKGQTAPLQREQWFGDVGARVLVTGQTIDAGLHG